MMKPKCTVKNCGHTAGKHKHVTYESWPILRRVIARSYGSCKWCKCPQYEVKDDKKR